ncbi:MAG TPA: FHA domain-containing protein, partial [Myxococcales bacterium]|nr:FHA domain-containing protein [Myxococcales bacterium]
MTVCAVCYRENDPVAGRCPSCGAPRTEAAEEAPRPPRPSPASGPRLTLRGPNGEATEYPLGASNVLGRSTTASVRLSDREVSRKHSQIDREGEEYVLRDLGSSNGTFLNG